jgi:nucleotide-binding universal stress UspA family protein
MNKILVPTDFSDTSKNAARFAAAFAQEIANVTVVLYHSFDALSAGSEGSAVFDDTQARRTISLAALHNLKRDLELYHLIPIECVAEEGNLVDSLEKFLHHYTIDLIVMGITGATRLEQIFIGSNTLKVVSHVNCPVMIIPPDASYHSIKKVVFATDFRQVATTTPVFPLRSFLSQLNPALYVVHVDENEQEQQTDDFRSQKALMDKILEDYQPEYSFIRKHDFVESINQFVLDRQADLIITVPKKHGFLDNLFKSGHTQKLAYHSHIPILALHE